MFSLGRQRNERQLYCNNQHPKVELSVHHELCFLFPGEQEPAVSSDSDISLIMAMEVGLSDVELSTDQDCEEVKSWNGECRKKGLVGPQAKEGRRAPRRGLGTHTSRTPWHLQGAPLKNGPEKQYPKSHRSDAVSLSLQQPVALATWKSKADFPSHILVDTLLEAPKTD